MYDRAFGRDVRPLRALVAIDNVAARPAKPVDEVFTGRELTTIPAGTVEDVQAAVTRARAAHADWAHNTVTHRAAVIERFRGLVVANRDQLMDVAQAEAGKARWAAQEEILDIMLNARYYTRQAPKLLPPQRVRGLLPGMTKTVVHRHPKGVVGVISPWNYPLTSSLSDSIPALLAGNAVVVKPDSQTPYCTLALAELLYQAGLPREMFAVVPGPGSVVGTAIADTCDYLMFTESTATGKLLAEQARAAGDFTSPGSALHRPLQRTRSDHSRQADSPALTTPSYIRHLVQIDRPFSNAPRWTTQRHRRT